MTPYLQQLAKHILQNYSNTELAELCFIFPNRRAGVYFQHYLHLEHPQPLLTPQIITIADLFAIFHHNTCDSRLGLLFKLYDCYCTEMQEQKIEPQTFGNFLSLGETLLSDFNNIDNYLVNAKLLFSNIKDLDKTSTDYLTDEQKKAISTLFTLPENNPDSLRQKFIAIWSWIYPLYIRFKQRLTELNTGYEGMLHRQLIESNQELHSPYKKIVVVGLNALNLVEKKLFEKLQNEILFFWDAQSEPLKDEKNKASFFMGNNQKQFKETSPIALEALPTDVKVECVALPSNIGQTQWVCKLLSQLSENEANHTAVILSDEKLLLPMLYAIPNNIPKSNVTMGYPMRHTHVLGELIKCLQTSEEQDCNTLIELLISTINQQQNLLQELQDADNTNNEPTLNNKQWLRYFYDQAETSLLCLQNQLYEIKFSIDKDTLCYLIKKLLGNISVAFEGEPLGGLQIMGMLETRCLDFDRVIICSLNEGIFPKNETAPSFIPYSLRHAFGLPTTEHQDAIFAYHFYRLIQRASHITFLYGTQSDGASASEESRYLKQLRYLYHWNFSTLHPTQTVYTSQQEAIIIKKDQTIISQLKAIKKLSPSDIKLAVGCPLHFYYKCVCQVPDPQNEDEIMPSSVFGTLFHKVMQLLYQDFYTKKLPVTTNFKPSDNDIYKLIEKAYQEILGITTIEGVHLIYQKILLHYTKQVLQNDLLNAPFLPIGLEQVICADLQLSFGSISIKGIIDRIDQTTDAQGNTHIRIVDYKTGKESCNYKTINDLFESNENGTALQMLLYQWMYHSNNPSAQPNAHIISLKTTQNQDLIYNQENINDFIDALKTYLEQLFDATTPFVQTQQTNNKACSFCPYVKSICQKEVYVPN